jgi:hypothetical protein
MAALFAGLSFPIAELFGDNPFTPLQVVLGGLIWSALMNLPAVSRRWMKVPDQGVTPHRETRPR